PVLLAVLVPDRRRVRRGWLELTLSATIVLSMLLAVFAQSSVSLLYCVPPVLTLATFRLGIRGAASAILLTAVAAIWATVNELGPFHQAQGGTLERLYMLQGFVAFVSLTTLPIAAALGRAESLLLEIRQVNGALAQAREEADHARLEAESARSEALDYARRYQDLADNATDIVLRFDRDGLISYASPAVSMLGLTPDQAVGQTTVSLLGAANAGEATTELRQLFDLDQDGSEDANRHEYRVALPDGGRIWLESHSKVLRNEHGRPVEAVSLFRDHTARHQLEESLRAARQSAERAAAVKSEFLANMSHELRTPLNSIVGFSQLLQGTAGLTPVQRRYLDVVSSSSRNLLAIINDLLDFSSLEAGGLRLEIQPFSFATLVEQAVESLRIQAEDKNLALSMVLDERLAARHVGDEGRLRQILLNLMSNALKFTEAGRVDVVVRVVDQRAGEQTLAVLVRDTGIG
ncbi:MAG: PAS domain S-box protein, partial [Xanthomonadales bacterium]|nr:PAS domain S-box protein [Xanthomonadales bacterium]